jgi:hypothetical protein
MVSCGLELKRSQVNDQTLWSTFQNILTKYSAYNSASAWWPKSKVMSPDNIYALSVMWSIGV